MSSEKKILSNDSAFTLIELLVSIFIIGLISGVFMVNYHNTNKRSELTMVKQKMASDIRMAENNGLGSKTYSSDLTPTGGWGVHFDITQKSKYIIFADQDGDKKYNPNNSEAIETKVLPAGVTINSIKANDIESSPVDIIFFPPDPVIYINGLKNSDARIELKENINNSTAAVTVNFFGLIDTD